MICVRFFYARGLRGVAGFVLVGIYADREQRDAGRAEKMDKELLHQILDPKN